MTELDLAGRRRNRDWPQSGSVGGQAFLLYQTEGELRAGRAPALVPEPCLAHDAVPRDLVLWGTRPKLAFGASLRGAEAQTAGRVRWRS